jgi:hypothetical protein
MEHWLLPAEEKVLNFLLPVVAELHSKLVLKEIDVGPLIPPVSEEVSPIFIHHFRRGGLPGLQFLDFRVIDIMELLLGCAKKISRAENVRVMVVKFKVVIHNGIVGVVCL